MIPITSPGASFRLNVSLYSIEVRRKDVEERYDHEKNE
jgi:hypothetical protein